MDQRVEKCIEPDGGLGDGNWYLCWWVGREKAVLDGEFTSSELRSIADHMDKATVSNSGDTKP